METKECIWKVDGVNMNRGTADSDKWKKLDDAFVLLWTNNTCQ